MPDIKVEEKKSLKPKWEIILDALEVLINAQPEIFGSELDSYKTVTEVARAEAAKLNGRLSKAKQQQLEGRYKWMSQFSRR